MHDPKHIIQELVNLKLALLSRKDNRFDEYSPCFMFTTENISAYLKQIDVKDKDVLVPCASGDHALEALNLGAKKIDMFDINSYAYHGARLKFAGVKCLSKEEFLDFFADKDESNLPNPNFLSKKVYNEKIRKCLPQYSRNFWDQIYKIFKDGNNIKKGNLIIEQKSNKRTITNLLDYLKDDNFDKLKEKINLLDEENIDYCNVNVVDLPNSLTNNYDIIMLSNIQDYVEYTYRRPFVEAIETYRNFVEKELSKNLNKDGIILSEYYYYCSRLSTMQDDDEHSMLRVNSVFDIAANIESDEKDAVMIYKKRS